VAPSPHPTSRIARDDEVAAWRDDGWVLLRGLVAPAEIDAAVADLRHVFPEPERFHADPESHRPPGRSTAELRRGHPEYPETGPAFRPEQHRFSSEFPFHGRGLLSRLTVHPSIVDFVERALGTHELRVYQAQVSAKYAGDANFEQPMHTDRNHSWLPPRCEPPWWHVESFLYLSDVEADTAPTHLVRRADAAGRSPNDVVMPSEDPDLYAHEHAATGPRGSLLAYRPDVFHRGVDLARPGGHRFLLNVSYKVAGQDWVGYHAFQSRVSYPAWATFVAEATPRELELFGFPPPGHPVWTRALLEATVEKYPGLDAGPWVRALRT
jgi:hypothetical protein